MLIIEPSYCTSGYQVDDIVSVALPDEVYMSSEKLYSVAEKSEDENDTFHPSRVCSVM